MKLQISIPKKSDLLVNAIPISVSEHGEKWSKNQLGKFANLSGVYIHFSNNEILYIGQTTKGKWGTFSERLRREFQKRASRNSSLFQLLSEQENQIKTALLDLDMIEELVEDSSGKLTKERKALTIEQILIGVYDPIGNKI